MSAKFFINEENMGNDFGASMLEAAGIENPTAQWSAEVEKKMALTMIEKLRKLGWDVSYGDSINNRATEYESQVFDAAWNAYIQTPKSWMVLQSDRYGPEAVPLEERSE